MEWTTLNKPKVLVAMLTGGMNPAWQLNDFLAKLAKDDRAIIDVRFFAFRPAEENRNRAVAATVEGGYDYMLMVDPDTIPQRNPIDLVLMDFDIVGMPYPGIQYPNGKMEIGFLAMDKQEDGKYLDHKDRHGLQVVDAVGSGAMIVARRVLEKIRPAFMRLWDENGYAIKGIDFNFCDRAKAEGFKVYAHYGYLADHLKEVSLLKVLEYTYGRE